MKKLYSIFLFLLMFGLMTPMALLAQGTEIDVPAILTAAEAIFLAGVGGLGVTALVAIIKRWLKADGIGTIIISVVVAAGATLAYLIPVGFILWKFLAYTALVSLAANGIYLFPQKRTA